MGNPNFWRAFNFAILCYLWKIRCSLAKNYCFNYRYSSSRRNIYETIKRFQLFYFDDVISKSTASSNRSTARPAVSNDNSCLRMNAASLSSRRSSASTCLRATHPIWCPTEFRSPWARDRSFCTGHSGWTCRTTCDRDRQCVYAE